MRSRRVLAFAALLAIAVLGGAATGAGARTGAQIGARTGTVTTVVVTPAGGTAENGTVTARPGGDVVVVIPYRRIGVVHHVELRDGAGDVVDSFDVTVPPGETPVTVRTAKGVALVVATVHSAGLNGSPSRGTLTYTPPAAVVAPPSSTSSTTTSTTEPRGETDAAANEPELGDTSDSGGNDLAPLWIGLAVVGVIVVGGGVVLILRADDDGCDCEALLAELAAAYEKEATLERALERDRARYAQAVRTAAAADREAAKIERLLARHNVELEERRRADLEQMRNTAAAARRAAADLSRAITANERALDETRAFIAAAEEDCARCGCEAAPPPEPEVAERPPETDDFFDALFDGLMALDPHATKLTGAPTDGTRTVSGVPLNPVGPSVADDPEYVERYGGVPDESLEDRLYRQRRALQAANPGVYVGPVSVFAPAPPSVTGPRVPTEHQSLIALREERRRMESFLASSDAVDRFFDALGVGSNRYAHKAIVRIDDEIADFKADAAAGGDDWAACQLWWDREQQWAAYKYAIQHCFMQPVQYAFGVRSGVQGMQQSVNASLDNAGQQRAIALRNALRAREAARAPAVGGAGAGGAGAGGAGAPPPKPPPLPPPPPPPPPPPVAPRQVSRAAAEAKVMTKLVDNRPVASDTPVAIRHKRVNCPYTSMLTAERIRGGDVSPVAPPFVRRGGIAFLENHFGGRFVPANPQAMRAIFTAKGSGSQGIVYVKWRQGGAHVFNVVNQDGHVFFVDGQTGKGFQGWNSADPRSTKVMIIR